MSNSLTVTFLARVVRLIFPVLTAGLVHVAVLKTDLLHGLAIPLDAGRVWRGRRLFGVNKTWRGVLLMTALTAGFTRLQVIAWPQKSPEGRSWANPWVAGSLMGLSYCMAELPNSAVKRQFGIPPGGRARQSAMLQYVADQTDSVAGCLIAARFLYRTPPPELAAAFLLGTLIHIGVDRMLYAIGVKHLDA